MRKEGKVLGDCVDSELRQEPRKMFELVQSDTNKCLLNQYYTQGYAFEGRRYATEGNNKSYERVEA